MAEKGPAKPKESKEKNTSKGERIQFTQEKMEEWYRATFFPGFTKAALCGGAWGLAAVFAGVSILMPNLEMKENHPLMDKLGDALKGIFK